MLSIVLLSVAGGFGATLRFLVDRLIQSRNGTSYPLGTVVVNLTGSLVLGFVTGLAIGRVLPEEWQLIFGAGFLGGYTTFSTASFETVHMIRSRRYAAALVNGFGILIASVVFAALGLWFATLIP